MFRDAYINCSRALTSSKIFRKIRNDRGVLLLEALLSVVILAISITFILQSLTQSLRTTSIAQQYTNALLLADNKLSEAMQSPQGLADGKQESSFPEPNDKYEYVLSYEPSVDTNLEHLNDLELSVSWLTRGKRKKLSFQTYKMEVPDE